MVVSREAKKQHACVSSGPRTMSIFTWMAALKFESAVISHYSSVTYLITDLARSN